MRLLTQIKRSAVSLLLAVGLVVPAFSMPAYAVAPNLVSNGDFETAASGGPQPANWFQDSWGTNTPAFSYLSEGHGGTHAIRTTITNYQDGDAKWLFNAVTITPTQTYTYSDWYRADTTTNLWARVEMQNGSVQYQWLKSFATATTWTQASANFTAPAGSARVSIFHVINNNGQLDIDDVNLTQQMTCTPPAVNGLANGDFEQACSDSPTTPAGWQSQTYGPDPVTYSYSTDAHSGSRAASMTTSSENDEAGWTTTIQSPASNQRYALSFWQKGSTYLYTYLTFNLADGTSKDLSLMSAPATLGAWSQYKDAFVTPAGTESIKVVIATSGLGNVTLDDVALLTLTNQTPADFTAGMVSITFDDGLASTYTKGTSVLAQYGFKATYYVNAGSLGSTGFMTATQLKSLAAAGHEIGSHLYHHSDMVQLDTATIMNELDGNKATLQQTLGTGYSINSFASPYGSYTSGDIDTVMQYQASHRTTDGEMNTKANLDPRQIHARLVTSSTTLAEVKAWIAEAKAAHAWLVLVYHGIAPAGSTDPAGELGFSVTPTQFKNQMSALKASGISVQTTTAALAALASQL